MPSDEPEPERSRHVPESCSRLSVKPENGGKRLVDSPHLLWRRVAQEVAESLGIDRADLLDENPRPFAGDVNLRPERRWPCAPRRGSDDDDGAREKLVCLDHDAEPVAVLLVTDARG